MTNIPTQLFHVTTEKKAKQYIASKSIHLPVRGFTNLTAAMAWAMKVNRKVIYCIPTVPEKTHKLPDHHNDFGQAWWIDQNIPMDTVKCAYSAGGSI
jgi:hypothetical protein